jgi:hypothetical protein
VAGQVTEERLRVECLRGGEHARLGAVGDQPPGRFDRDDRRLSVAIGALDLAPDGAAVVADRLDGDRPLALPPLLVVRPFRCGVDDSGGDSVLSALNSPASMPSMCRSGRCLSTVATGGSAALLTGTGCSAPGKGQLARIASP